MSRTRAIAGITAGVVLGALTFDAPAGATGPRPENSTDYPAGTPPPSGQPGSDQDWDWYWGGDPRLTAEDPYSDPYTAG